MITLLEDRTFLISIHMETMKKIITQILGKIDQALVPNTARSLLALTLVLS